MSCGASYASSSSRDGGDNGADYEGFFAAADGFFKVPKPAVSSPFFLMLCRPLACTRVSTAQPSLFVFLMLTVVRAGRGRGGRVERVVVGHPLLRLGMVYLPHTHNTHTLSSPLRASPFSPTFRRVDIAVLVSQELCL